MQIIERSAAKAQNLKHYYTGRKCRNGHDAHRYTQSGTCSACVTASNDVGRGEFSEAKGSRVDAKAQLVPIKIRAFPEDYLLLHSTAVALAVQRYPCLTGADIKRVAPSQLAGGTGLYVLLVAVDDAVLIRDTANALLGAHRVDIDEARRRAHGSIAAEVVAGEPVPDWANRP